MSLPALLFYNVSCETIGLSIIFEISQSKDINFYVSCETLYILFRSRGLSRRLLNFVFLRTLLYDCTACEQKTKNTKSTVNSMFAVLLYTILTQ